MFFFLTSLLGKELFHKQEQAIITPQEIMSLNVGEFVGKVAESGSGFFKMQLQPISSYAQQWHYKQFKPLPVIHEQVDIAANFTRIQQETAYLVSQYDY